MILLATLSAMATTVTLTNSPNACIDTYEVHPLVGEEDNLAAVKLTPPSYPATVTAVTWSLAHGQFGGSSEPFCDAALEYEVLVFKSLSPAPPASPTIIETITVPASSLPSTKAIYYYTETLSTPITLTVGEKLYVAVRLTGDPDTDVVCISMCRNSDWRKRLNWWSYSDAAPYPWDTMENNYIYQNFIIEASATIP